MSSKLAKIAVFSALISACTLTYAADTMKDGEFLISNQTSRTVSFDINGVCSNEIGNLEQYTFKVYSSEKIINECATGSFCQIKAYDQANCTGGHIGKATFKFESNWLEVSASDESNISITGSIGLNHQYSIFLNERGQQAKNIK